MINLLLLVAAFALGTGVAELAGAESLGVAMTIGLLAFTATLMYVLLRR